MFTTLRQLEASQLGIFFNYLLESDWCSLDSISMMDALHKHSTETQRLTFPKETLGYFLKKRVIFKKHEVYTHNL